MIDPKSWGDGAAPMPEPETTGLSRETMSGIEQRVDLLKHCAETGNQELGEHTAAYLYINDVPVMLAALQRIYYAIDQGLIPKEVEDYLETF
jgi:hypothetical protein